MPTGVYKRTELNSNKGKKWSKEVRQKISNSHKGMKLSEEHKEKLRLSHIGKKQSAETISKRALKNTGKKRTKEQRERISKAVKGFKHTQEAREKMKGNKNGWQGGKSFEEYPVNWTDTLKRSIRERDRYTCQMCSKQQGDKVFCVHHIDYNKKNCNPDNLMTLCRSCHAKTNYNRDKWIKYFNQKV